MADLRTDTPGGTIMTYKMGRAIVVLFIQAFAILFALAAMDTKLRPDVGTVDPMWSFAVAFLFAILFTLAAAGLAGTSDKCWGD